MNKKNVVTSIIIGSFLLLILGGGALLLNRNSNKEMDNMIKLADDYTNENEYEKALGILEALYDRDKNNEELLKLINSVKDKKRIFNQSVITKDIETELLRQIDILVDGLDQVLMNNQINVFEELMTEILNIEPGNAIITKFEENISIQKNDLIKNKENINSTFNNLTNAVKSRDIEVLEKTLDNLSKEFETTLNTLQSRDLESLKEELSRLEPKNSKLSESIEAISNTEEKTDKLKKDLKDFESYVKDVLHPDYKSKTSQAEELIRQAQQYLLDNNIDEAKKLIDEALKLDPENIDAITLKNLLDSGLKLEEIKAKELIRQAQQYLLDNNIDEAKRLITEALKLDPNNIDALTLKNLMNSESKQEEIEAETLEPEALEPEVVEPEVVEPEVVEPEVVEQNETIEPEINISDLINQADLYEKNSQYKKQLEVLSQILDMEPSAAFYVKAGIASYKLNKYKQAVGFFKQAIDMDSSYPGTYYPMALSYEKLDDSENLEKMLNIGLKLRPNHGATNYELGRFYTSKGLYVEALELFLNAQRINENSLKYQLGVALAYFNLNEFEKSIKIYENINTQNSNISEVYYNLSMARAKLGQLDQAFDDISKAMSLKPDVPSYLYTIGEISEALGFTEKAAGYYLDALKLDFSYYRPMLNLGNIYDKLGRYQDSVSLLERALKLSPKDQNAKFSLGTAYLHNKQYSKSITLLKDTHKSDPQSTVKLFTLALAYTEIGDIKAAEESYKSVIKMDSKYYDAYYYLGQLLYSVDRIEEARTFFNKVLELNPTYKYKSQILELP